MDLFPTSFIFCLVLCNFIQGFKQLLDLTLLNIFKEKLNMEPAELQIYMAIISIPWSLKFLYQLTSEMFDKNLKMKKGYLIVVNSIINVISMMFVIGYGLKQEASKAFITIMIFISQINMAYCDTVTDMYLVQIRETMFA